MLTYEGFPTSSILSSDALIDGHDGRCTLFEYMRLDFIQQDRPSAEASNLCLADIDTRLNHMGKSMADFFEPEWCPREARTELQREQLRYSNESEQRAICDRFRLDTKPGPKAQSAIRNWCVSGDATVEGYSRAIGVEVAFAQGEAGTGKTQVATHALAAVRAAGAVALVAAATNLAATLFDGGWSLHALAKIPVEKDSNGNLFIRMAREGGTMTPQRLALLQGCSLLIVDEGPNLDKSVLEALLDFLREHGCNMRVLICGDLRQIPPVVQGGSREQIIEASIVTSHEFPTMAKFALTQQYRAASDDEWAADVRGLGNGTAPTVPHHPDADKAKGVSIVPMPLVQTLFHEHAAGDYRRAAVEWLFGRNRDGRLDVGMGENAILCMKNKAANEWNEYVSSLLAAESNATSREYHAYHQLDVKDGLDAGDEALASAMGPDEMAQVDHADNSAPLGKVTIRVGDVMLLLKTLDKVAGLVKNVRVKVLGVRWNSVEVALPRANGVHTRHTLGRAYFRMAMKPGSPLIIVRKQIPLKHAYAISVNKSQGQTMSKVLFDARGLAFSGGQQYVACSRVRTRADFAAVVGDANVMSEGSRRTLVVANVVYHELLLAMAECSASGGKRASEPERAPHKRGRR